MKTYSDNWNARHKHVDDLTYLVEDALSRLFLDDDRRWIFSGDNRVENDSAQWSQIWSRGRLLL